MLLRTVLIRSSSLSRKASKNSRRLHRCIFLCTKVDYCCYLQDEGVDFVVDGMTYNFRGSLALVCADNLASQLIGGYKALNSALRKCRQCMAVGEDMCCKVSMGLNPPTNYDFLLTM